MRDKFQDKAKVEESIAFYKKALDTKDLDFYKKKYLADSTKVDSNGYRDLRFLLGGLLNAITRIIPLEYSRGTDVLVIYDLYFKDFIARYRYLAGELAAGHPKGFIYGAKGEARQNHDDHSVYTWFCWVLCLAGPEDDYSDISQYLAEPKLDLLCDILLQFSGQKNPISNKCNHPDSFGLLHELVGLNNTERERIIKLYLDAWPSKIGTLSAYSIGIKCTGLGSKKVTTKKHLEKGIDGHFIGYWAWEAALAVKLFNIDDSSFKHNEYYPYDLVHFRAPLDNQAFLNEILILNHREENEKGEAYISPLEQDLTNFVLNRNLVVLEDVNPSSKISVSDNFPRDESKNYLYRAVLSDESGEINPSSAVIDYSVAIVNSAAEIKNVESELLWAKKEDGWLVGADLDLSFSEIFKYAGSMRFTFMDEFFLRLDNKFRDSVMAYGGRHNENKVPPIVRLQYTKAINDELMLAIYCVVREDMSVSYNQVSKFWLALIDRYEHII